MNKLSLLPIGFATTMELMKAQHGTKTKSEKKINAQKIQITIRNKKKTWRR